MDLTINCKNLQVSPNSGNKIELSIDSADAGEILEHFTLKDIIDHFGSDELLDQIGQSEAEKYFDLIPNK